jgi:periplasmic protein TonB
VPREMFGEVAHPTVKVGSRSKYTVLVSVAAHVLIAAMVVIVPLMATDVLPTPRTVIGVFAAERAAPPPPPPPAAAPPSARATQPVTASPDAAPSTAPESIEPEAPTTSSVIGEPGGVEGGVPFGVVGSPGVMPGVPPSPPPAAVQKPLPIGGRIKEPAKVRHVPPVYPAIAQQARVEGIVIIEAIIGTDGRVQQARVLRSKPLLDDAALAAVRQWVFTPTLLNGVPVPVIMTVTVNFRLR